MIDEPKFCSQRLTVITFLGLSLVCLLAGSFGAILLIRAVERSHARLEMTSSAEYGKRYAAFLKAELDAAKTPGDVLATVQRTLTASPNDSGRYICIMATSGEVLCHPRGELLGREANPQFLTVSGPGESGVVGWRQWLEQGQLEGQLLLNGEATELIRRIPVPGTDWHVLVHTELAPLKQHSRELAYTIISVMVPTGFFFILFGTLVVRTIGREYERGIEQANAALEEKVATRTQELQQTITELSRTRAALDLSEKMALLGQLVAGIAHEINNPLNVIAIQAENLREHAREEDERRACDAIQRSAQRCGFLVRNLLSFARNDPPSRESNSLRELIDTSLALASGQTYKLRVRVESRFPDGDITINVDRIQIEQVILNLISNAAQALATTAGEKRIVVEAAIQHDHARIIVEDNGPGLDPAMRERLFEPFQTTKEAGSGTGLGLSLCRRFVEGHGGSISHEDVETGGTRFVIRLPMTTAPTPAFVT
jgi:signal transduction histidine kinase